MAGNRFRNFLVLAAAYAALHAIAAWAQAPDAPSCAIPSAPATASATSGSTAGASNSGSSSHQNARHVQVPDENAPIQPAELTEAEEAITKKNYAAAAPPLRKLVARDPSNFEGWFDLGFVENALGNVAESIVAYRKSVAAKPDVFESNLNLGLQLAKTGQPDGKEFLRAATRLTPTSHSAEGHYRAWLALGDTLKKASPDEALAAYRQAQSLESNEAEPHLAAGVLLEEENKAADAEQEYKQALTIDPGSPDAAIALANLYMHGRRFPEAEGALRTLVAERPSAAVEIQLGRVLAAEGKNDEAVAAMVAGTNLAPGDQEAQRDLGDLYSLTGKNDLAESAYRTLVAAHPNDPELHRKLGQALLRQKQFPGAEQEFLLTVKLKPDFGEAYGALAFAAGENKEFDLVVRSLNARAKLLPEIPITYFLRASALDHLHDWKGAAVSYRLFLNSAQGLYPDYEWQAKHRLIAIEPKK
jgi:Flp pilus assembly protein TadD